MTGNIAQFFSQQHSQPQQILCRHFVDKRGRDASVAEVATHLSRWQAGVGAKVSHPATGSR